MRNDDGRMQNGDATSHSIIAISPRRIFLPFLTGLILVIVASHPIIAMSIFFAVPNGTNFGYRSFASYHRHFATSLFFAVPNGTNFGYRSFAGSAARNIALVLAFKRRNEQNLK